MIVYLLYYYIMPKSYCLLRIFWLWYELIVICLSTSFLNQRLKKWGDAITWVWRGFSAMQLHLLTRDSAQQQNTLFRKVWETTNPLISWFGNCSSCRFLSFFLIRLSETLCCQFWDICGSKVIMLWSRPEQMIIRQAKRPFHTRRRRLHFNHGLENRDDHEAKQHFSSFNLKVNERFLIFTMNSVLLPYHLEIIVDQYYRPPMSIMNKPLHTFELWWYVVLYSNMTLVKVISWVLVHAV